MLEYQARRLSLGEVSASYIPFGVLLAAAMLGAEMSNTLNTTRGIYAIWLSMVFAIPAFSLYILAGNNKFAQNSWKLCWSFAFFAYLIHFYYTAFIKYGGIAGAFQGQGADIAIPNFILTAWWALDVILLWTVKKNTIAIMVQRFLVNIMAMVLFFAASVILIGGTVSKAMGIVMALVILVSLGFRIKRAFTG